MQTAASVYLLTDDERFTQLLTSLISSVGLRIMRFEDGLEFLSHFDSSQPGCLIIDLGKPYLHGLQVVDELLQLPLKPPVIGLIGHLHVSEVIHAARHGVLTFLTPQDASHTEILDVIQSAITLDSRQRADFARCTEIRQLFKSLTAAEQQLLQWLLSGDELLTIAEKLKVSRRTVENRRIQLMQKLQVSNLTDLVSMAMDNGDFPASPSENI